MGLSRIAKQKTMAEAEAEGTMAAGTHSIAELRAMSTADVSQNLRGVTRRDDRRWLDPFPKTKSITFAKGKQNDVDILVGSNRDEGTLLGGGSRRREQAKTRAEKTFGSLTPGFLELWPASMRRWSRSDRPGAQPRRGRLLLRTRGRVTAN